MFVLCLLNIPIFVILLSHCYDSVVSVLQIYYANGARIVRGDIVASNGVIHIVDTIMSTMTATGGIYDKLINPVSQNTKVPQPKFT
jgi:hypothetical protein